MQPTGPQNIYTAQKLADKKEAEIQPLANLLNGTCLSDLGKYDGVKLSFHKLRQPSIYNLEENGMQ
jgi:hypothetical protein